MLMSFWQSSQQDQLCIWQGYLQDSFLSDRAICKLGVCWARPSSRTGVCLTGLSAELMIICQGYLQEQCVFCRISCRTGVGLGGNL